MKRALERAKNKGKARNKKKGKAQVEKKEFLDGSDNITNSKARRKAKHGA